MGHKRHYLNTARTYINMARLLKDVSRVCYDHYIKEALKQLELFKAFDELNVTKTIEMEEFQKMIG